MPKSYGDTTYPLERVFLYYLINKKQILFEFL